jgi:hypothetical protein
MNRVSAIGLSSLLLLLAGRSASEASAVQPQVVEQSGEPGDLGRAELPVANQGRARPAHVSGPLRAVVQWISEGNERCGDDAMRLVIMAGDKEVDSRDYCSAYALGRARLITDARDRHYVLLEHGVGRGTRATSWFLTIYEFEDILDERARLLTDEPTGWQAMSTFHYDVDTPPNGGIVIRGPWTIDGEMGDWGAPPDRNRTLLALDTER